MDSIRKIYSAKGHQQPLLNCCPLRVLTSKVCGILHTVATRGIQSWGRVMYLIGPAQLADIYFRGVVTAVEKLGPNSVTCLPTLYKS